MLRAYAQLLRIPNVFTAMADVYLGWFIAGGIRHVYLGQMSNGELLISPDRWWDLRAYDGLNPLSWAVAASCCLYCAGMVLNDYFDVEQDRRERPWRPIPSGRISRRQAGWIGVGLILAALVFSGLAAACRDSFPVLFIVPELILLIVAYDAAAKRTAFGPLFMGGCRVLNVLLGVSVVLPPIFLEPFLIAGVIGLYITGVTWFAGREALSSSPWQLCAAAGVMTAAIALAYLVPVHRWSLRLQEESQERGVRATKEYRDIPIESIEVTVYPYLLTAWCVIIALPIARAICEPSPQRVQTAVKTCILGLIGLDAILAFGVVGWPGLLILVLWVPALLLGRWVYST